MKVYITVENHLDEKIERVVGIRDGFPFPDFQEIVGDMVDTLTVNKEPEDFSEAK